MPDKFSNVAWGEVTQSATDTLTFSQIQTSISVHDKVAWNIHQVWFYPTTTAWQELQTNSDIMRLAITVSNQGSDLTAMEDPSIVCFLELLATVAGTAATRDIHKNPVVVDYSTLPGGGILIPPNPVYVAMDSTGFAAARASQFRIYYTSMELKTDEFWELVEARRIVQ